MNTILKPYPTKRLTTQGIAATNNKPMQVNHFRSKHKKCLCALMCMTLSLVACHNSPSSETTDNQAESLEATETTKPNEWQNNVVKQPLPTNLTLGSSYLSIYPTIYDFAQHKKRNLTAVINLRNLNGQDNVYLTKADYYDNQGKLIRSYLTQPIVIHSKETLEIMIDQTNQENRSGSSFIFDWQIQPNSHPPLFEALMTSTLSQQGISFTTQGIRIK